LINVVSSDFVIFTSRDQQLGDWINANVSPSSIILTTPDHRHPIPALSGRSVVMGYEGWLWSRGIDYSERRGHAVAMWQGHSSAVANFKKYDTKYIVRGPGLDSSNLFGRSVWQKQDEFIKQYGTKVFDNKVWEVFVLNKLK